MNQRDNTNQASYGKLYGLFIAVAGLLLLHPFSLQAADLPTVTQLFKDARQEGTFQTSNAKDLAQAENLFVRLLKGERSNALTEAWRSLGFQLRQARINERIVLVLMEDPKHKLGRGFYLFPLKAAGSDLLMMPHSFFDLHTGRIGMRLFDEGLFCGAAWNTVHRHKYPGGGANITDHDDDLPNWDLADLQDTCFTAMTRAFARAFPLGHLVQLHGFSKEKRKSRAGRDSDIVLTNGTETPSKNLIALGDCLKIRLAAMVRVYPTEIRDLGGTENVSGIILNTLGHNGFIQIEICRPLREKLKKSASTRKTLISCMREAWH